MADQYPWLEIAKRLQALAQAGLAYNTSDYDLERYTEIQDIAATIISDLSETEIQVITDLFLNETGYRTPKVDVRAVIFREGQILLVQEKVDGNWSLPGGWADVGYTPAEVAVKETQEEAGLDVTAEALLGVLDKTRQAGPPSINHIYKIFIRCNDGGGDPAPGSETLAARFFQRSALPPLSIGRTTPEQIERLYGYLENPDAPPMLD